MKSNKTIKNITAVCVFAVSINSLADAPSPNANEKSCLISGEITLYGNKINVKDCMKLNEVPASKVKQICEKTLKTGSFGEKGLSLSYSKNCPKIGSQGACLGLKYEGTDMNAYYYNRDKSTLPAMVSACKAQGDIWK